jgi:psiF repeat
MRNRLAASVVVLLALSCALLRADNSQQEKMKKCNEIANQKQLKGDDRKSFMSTCLSAKAPDEAAMPEGKMSQQDKMKKCNEVANKKQLKGDDRKNFMSSCLSASAPPAK